MNVDGSTAPPPRSASAVESGAGWARTREAERTREVERTEDADASDEQSTRAHMASFILARMGRRTLIFSVFFAEVMMTK